jgi:hypothetical protein
MTAAPVPSGAQDHQRMMTMLTGFWVTQIVRAAATFNLGRFAVREAVGI